MIIIHLKIDAKKGMHSSCMPNKKLPKQRKMQQKKPTILHIRQLHIQITKRYQLCSFFNL